MKYAQTPARSPAGWIVLWTMTVGVAATGYSALEAMENESRLLAELPVTAGRATSFSVLPATNRGAATSRLLNSVFGNTQHLCDSVGLRVVVLRNISPIPRGYQRGEFCEKAKQTRPPPNHIVRAQRLSESAFHLTPRHKYPARAEADKTDAAELVQ